MAAGFVLVLAAFYFVAEVVTAHAWTQPYSVTRDSISSLGITTCTPEVCSPLHNLMNAAFIGLGVLIVVGALLLRHNIESVPARRWVLGLALVTGISTAATGVVPSNLGAAYHATAVIPGFVCRHGVLVLLTIFLWRSHRVTALWSGICAVTGLIGGVLLASPLGFGITERITLYPFTIWMVVAGAGMLVSSRRVAAPSRDHRT